MRLQIVFWLSAIPKVVTLLIAGIVGDFRDISYKALAIASLFFLALSGLSGISPHFDKATVLSFLSVLFSLMSFLFLFLPSLFLSLLSFGSLFGLVGLILALTLGGHIGF